MDMFFVTVFATKKPKTASQETQQMNPNAKSATKGTTCNKPTDNAT